MPAAASDWWSLHVSTWLPLGTGTDVPAPAYVLAFAVAALDELEQPAHRGTRFTVADKA